jgi:hypothetical protein
MIDQHGQIGIDVTVLHPTGNTVKWPNIQTRGAKGTILALLPSAGTGRGPLEEQAFVYCIREQADIPVDELRYDPKWGWVHQIADSMHTVNGYEIDGARPRVRNPRFE